MARVTKINVGGTNYDIAHEGELKKSGFEVVNQLPTDNRFAGREVFYDRNLQPYIWNGHDWITNYKTYKIVSAKSISQQGWYDIGYYIDTTTQGSNAFWGTEFHGTLRIITGYNLDRPLSLVLSISGGFTQLCMTQLSSCIGYGIIPKIRVVHNSELKRRILQFYYSANRRNSISIDYTDNSYYPPVFFMPLYAKSDVNYEGNAIIKEFTLTNGVKTNYNVEGASIIKTGGTATQMLMADGSTKDISGFATVATSGSYNDLTDTPNLATVATSGSYNDLTDKPTLATVATSGSYDDLLNKPDLVFSNIGGTISLVQIPDGLIANGKLANSSMTLNDTTVNLGDTAILPWYVDYNEVDYPARIREHWLQIYRNGVWANLMYLGDILPTQVGQITSLADLDWYNEQVSEYEVDSNTTTSILNGTTLPATVLLNCLAEQLTLNLYPISGKQYGKGSLDSLITDLQGKGFSVFVENDLDAIIGSGSDYLVRLKISKVPTTKAIIECYVAR